MTTKHISISQKDQASTQVLTKQKKEVTNQLRKGLRNWILHVKGQEGISKRFMD